METDGKEEKERTSNKGQWRPVYSWERQWSVCKWPWQAFASARAREPRKQPRAQSRLSVRDVDQRKHPAEAAPLRLRELEGCKHTPETQHGTISYKKTFRSIADPKLACHCHIQVILFLWHFFICKDVCFIIFFIQCDCMNETHTHTHTCLFLRDFGVTKPSFLK